MNYSEFDLSNYGGDRYVEEFPGSVWRYLDYLDGSRLILSPNYLDLPEAVQLEIMDLLRDNVVHGCGRYIDFGGEGYVYPCGAGNSYVLKVVDNPLTPGNKSPDERLIYTEFLRRTILPNLPRWADIVPNFLSYKDSKGVRYTIMPMVANGITIESLRAYWLKQYEWNTSFINERITQLFPGLDNAVCEQIEKQYSTLCNIIRRVANKEMSRDKVMDDYKYGNVLVTPYSQPVAGYNYGLSIIDQ